MPSRQTVLRKRRVFINIPFDHPYERLYIALIAGLGALGLLPQSVLQIPPSENRLRDLFDGVSFRQLSHAARQIAGRRHLLRS